jgi:hypothetical protein
VSEEAGKLFGAFSEWARDQASATAGGGGLGEGLAGLADHAAQAAHDLDEHLATGSPECTWCPLCRAVHAVRQTSPEVRAHLATAASSLLQAAAGLLATAVPQDESAAGRGAGVERIDLDPDHEGTYPDGDDEQGARQGWPEEDE